MRLFVPQTRNGGEPFQTVILGAFQRRSEVLNAMIPQLFVKGLSVRDVSATFREVLEGEGVSPATANRVAQSIREDFEAWRTRSLSGYDVLYLFVDGMRLKLHPDREEKQPILIAYAILWDGKKVLLHVDVADRESYEACLGFLRDMVDRGLRAPLLYCSDDCPGLRKALKAMWPRTLPQKCQVHKLRNILAKLPRGVQTEIIAFRKSNANRMPIYDG
jgi:transposase-like protein